LNMITETSMSEKNTLLESGNDKERQLRVINMIRNCRRDFLTSAVTSWYKNQMCWRAKQTGDSHQMVNLKKNGKFMAATVRHLMLVSHVREHQMFTQTFYSLRTNCLHDLRIQQTTKMHNAMSRSALTQMMAMQKRSAASEIMFCMRTWVQQKNVAVKARGDTAVAEASDTKDVTAWLLEEYKALLSKVGEESAIPLDMFAELVNPSP